MRTFVDAPSHQELLTLWLRCLEPTEGVLQAVRILLQTTDQLFLSSTCSYIIVIWM